MIHKFRDEALSSLRPPIEKVAIFDEAQRAWDADALMKFMKRKKGVPDFHQSEPEFLISIMERHQDWAVIICLVGGGQAINTGEVGIEEWLHALRKQYPDREIHLPDRMTDSEYVGSSDIQRMLGDRAYRVVSSLHLGVSLRSFRSERLADFVKALLDEDAAFVQGLEIDYGLLAWDAELRYCNGGFDYFDCRGARWMHLNQEQGQKYLKNAYRVLLTRARQGLIIFVPEGDSNDETRRPEYYDDTFEYLRSIGIQEI